MAVDPIAISRSALDVEWQRMQIVSQNLANENAVVGSGTAFRPQTLISGPVSDFAATLSGQRQTSGSPGVRVVAIEARPNAFRRVYEPNHPAADASGYVSYPNIDHAQEMVSLMRTARSYESNLTALSLAQQMAMRALDIGKR
ncbi:MAG: flagellar basal body rod protein FlgC [Novosphingobium sp.]|uniref:flagellar basal body rod protein FlgC n=1 Tax=Novosphingobium sp. TaxID=1874826 RepID=UPI0032B7915D